MNLILVNIFFVLQFFSAVLMHPIHVSLTSIEYKYEKHAFDITFKIFTDDFEKIISWKYGITLKISQMDEQHENIKYINQYISDCFNLVINKNITAELIYKEKKMNEEAVWLYYEYKNSGQVKSVSISNSIMMDLFEDQVNLIIFSYLDKQKGYQLNNKKKNVTFEF